MSSLISNLSILTVSSTSVIQIGDSVTSDSYANVLAIQRQEEKFYGSEAPFSMYSIFSRPPHIPLQCEEHTLFCSSKNYVQTFDLKGLATSSIIHVGDSRSMRMITRLKHIRQIEEPLNEEE